VAEIDAMEETDEIVDIVRAGKDTPDITGEMHGGKKAGVDPRTADTLVFPPGRRPVA